MSKMLSTSIENELTNGLHAPAENSEVAIALLWGREKVSKTRLYHSLSPLGRGGNLGGWAEIWEVGRNLGGWTEI
jgi:hypothetical protein